VVEVLISLSKENHAIDAIKFVLGRVLNYSYGMKRFSVDNIPLFNWWISPLSAYFFAKQWRVGSVFEEMWAGATPFGQHFKTA
jgi:hypothetical protein